MATTPTWSAARNGLPSDPGSNDASAQVNQFLGTHASSVVYNGSVVVTPSTTATTTLWQLILGSQGDDYDVPFVMSGSVIGRVTFPVLAVGSGADLVVTLSADSGGVPGSTICSTIIPAEWITQQSWATAAAGPPSQLIISETNNYLATAWNNCYLSTLGSVIPFPYPSSSGGLAAGNPTSCTDGAGYYVQVGGTNGSGVASTDVFTIGWSGGQTLNNATVQPALPIAHNLGVSQVVNSTVVVCGGYDATGTMTANVFTAGYTASTGTIATWSQQTSLPQALVQMSRASYNGVMYVIGGYNSSSVVQSTVYYATVANGQITSWSTGTPLPAARANALSGAVNGFLVVSGGSTTGGTDHNDVYYTYLDPTTGAPHQWITGPSLPAVIESSGGNPECQTLANSIAVATVPTGAIYLPIDATGVAQQWIRSGPAGTADLAYFPYGNGQYQYFDMAATAYASNTVFQATLVSVPLPSTGLTNGSTYHVTLQQRSGSGDNNNYLRLTQRNTAYPSGTTALQRPYGTSTWSAMSPSGANIPMMVFNNNQSGPVIHTWDDAGARTSTLLYAMTPDQRLLGVCEAVTQSSPPINAQPSFENGTGYWTPTGCTFAPSTAVTYSARGFSTSGLITPSGVAGQAYIESEQETVIVGDAYTMSAWVYSPTGYSSVAVNINWYTSIGAFLSTTSGTVTSVTANTWTQLTVATPTAGAPTSAARGTAVIVESGTPPVTALLYVASATLTPPARVFSSAESVNYGATWPSTSLWPPLGTTALA